jgi:DNA-binding transcriptional ArsR family regulator
LEPLNYTAIRKCYMDIFCLKVEEAEQMATLTKGYSFAFQVLGYLYWNHRDTKTIEDILAEYDQYLEEYVYSKIWSELSALDQKILIEMALSGETKVKDIREASGMKSEVFSVYRDRLKRRGIVDANRYGYLSFVLPRFEDFVKIHHI